MRAVLERDFLSEVGRPRAFAFRAFAAAIVALVLVLVFVENSWEFRRRPDTVAQTLFMGGSIAVLCVLAVLTPPSVVGSILEERQRETLPVVLTTPVGPFGFAAAKLIARSLSVLVWAAAALVPLAAVLLLGGVGTGQILDFAMIAVGAVLELAGWGVAISSMTKRLASAAVLSYLLPFARWLAFAVAAFFWMEPPPNAPRGGPWTMMPDGPTALLVSTPGPAVLHMCIPREWDRATADIYRPSGRTPPLAAGEPAAAFLLTGILFAGAGVLAAGLRLRREAEPQRGAGSGWLMRRLRRPIPPEGDALKWKETRLLNAAASRPLYYSVLVVLCASEVIFLVLALNWPPSTRDLQELGCGMLSAHLGLLGLVAAIVGAASVAQERTTGTLDLLRASPISPRSYLKAKVAGTLRGVLFLGLFPLLHLLVMGTTGIVAPITVAVAAVYAFLIPVSWALIGTAAGLSSSRPATAVARAGAAFGVMLIGLPLLAVVCDEPLDLNDAAEFLLSGWQPATVWLALDASERTFNSAGYPDWYGSRGLRDEHEGAIVWTAILVVITLYAWWRAPRRAEVVFDRERDGG